MKNIFLIAIVLMVTLTVSAKTAKTNKRSSENGSNIEADQRPIKSPFAQAKDYILATCIINRYQGKPLAKEAEGWVGGIVELGSLDPVAYPLLNSLVESAPAPRSTQAGEIMLLANCVDFHNDLKIHAKIKKVLATNK